MANKVKPIVFICSCDKTADILKYQLSNPFFANYLNMCEVYIGTNTNSLVADSPYNYLHAPKSNWVKETIYQLNQLKDKNPSFTHVTLWLDDYVLLRKADYNSYNRLTNIAIINNINYIRLVRLDGSIIYRLVQQVLRLFGKDMLPISKDQPYYSSLQVAIWNIDYLLRMLRKSSSIWEFETLVSDSTHYAVTKNNFIYTHVVEKGEWQPWAKHIYNFVGIKFVASNRHIRNVSFMEYLKDSFVFFLNLIFGRKILCAIIKIKKSLIKNEA